MEASLEMLIDEAKRADSSLEPSVAIGKAAQPDTPLKCPNPKRKKDLGDSTASNVSNEIILEAIKSLSQKFDEQAKRLTSFEKQIRDNTLAITNISHSLEFNAQCLKENVDITKKLKKQVDLLEKENSLLKAANLEHSRYKRRWGLRLNGLKEAEGEDTRETVIQIISKIVPHSPEKLRGILDVVHRLGVSNNGGKPRQIIIQFALRTMRDEVWKASKNAAVCKEHKCRFAEDLCKEDRESRAKLWPKVEEARRRGQKAYLREGYAVIDGKRLFA